MIKKIIIDGVKPRRQLTNYTCGPGALRTIFHFYELDVPEQELIENGEIEEDGTSHQQMRKLVRKYGFKFYSKSNGTLDDIKKWLKEECPIIVDYQDYDNGKLTGWSGHYAVIYGIDEKFIFLSDPANYYEGDGKKFANNKKMEIENFLRRWFDLDENEDEVHGWFAIVRPK